MDGWLVVRQAQQSQNNRRFFGLSLIVILVLVTIAHGGACAEQSRVEQTELSGDSPAGRVVD